MQRRSFLRGLAGVLAAGVAPAIVAEPMKLWVPKEPKIAGRGLTEPVVYVDESSYGYNLQAIRQSQLGEDFFPTVVVDPAESPMAQLHADFEGDVINPNMVLGWNPRTPVYMGSDGCLTYHTPNPDGTWNTHRKLVHQSAISGAHVRVEDRERCKDLINSPHQAKSLMTKKKPFKQTVPEYLHYIDASNWKLTNGKGVGVYA